MDTVLIILGLTGGCAIVASLVMSSSSSKRYANQDIDIPHSTGSHRRASDRRSGVVVQFPLMINNEMVAADRRSGPDRRAVAA